MNPRAIETAADLLWQARLAGTRLDALPPECRPASLDDGYLIQDMMAARIGRAVLGWKIAATSEAGRRRLEIDEPLAGRLFAGFVVDDGARLDAGAMCMRVVEPEFAFRLGRDLPPRARPYETEDVVAAVSDLHLAIEVPDSRFERSTEMGAPIIVADDGFAGWFVLGPKIARWRGLDLPVRPVRVLRNDQIAGESRGANGLGDPWQAFFWLAQDRARRGEGLKEGEIVTTGTCLAPIPIQPGDRVSVQFVDLGSVGVTFD